MNVLNYASNANILLVLEIKFVKLKLVCIPAYNEESYIQDVIKQSLLYADKVIVCDDGSTDDTKNVAKQTGAVVLSHKKNQGYGAAISTLFDYARKENAEIMVTIDGDSQHDPKSNSIIN